MSQIKNKKFQTIALVLGIATIAIFSGILSFGNENITEAQEPSATPDTKELSGYAWSSNVGWISMNCSNTGSCGPIGVNGEEHKVVLDEDTGNLTGYAWSSHAGWLQFGGYNTTDFPVDSSTQSINANIDTATGNMNGWVRFLGFGGDELTEATTTTASQTIMDVDLFDEEGVTITSVGFSENSSGSISDINLDSTNHARGVDNNTKSMTGLRGQSHYIMDITWTFTLPAPYDVSEVEFTRWIYGQFDGGSSQRYVYLIQNDGTRIPVATNSIGRKEGKVTENYNGDWDNVTAIEFRGYARKGSNGGSSGAVMLHEINLQGSVTSSETTQTSNIPTGILAWDGWVSLSGLSTDDSPYGPTRTGDTLTGYAWGDDVVGWIDMSGVSLSEPPAQCGNANAINISTKPVTDFCDTGTLSGVVSQADQDSWTWTCLNESSSEQCGASCSINEWICGDECISTSETCGNNDCPIGKIEQPVGSGKCEVDTGSCPVGEIEDPSNPGECIENTGSYNGDITAFIAQPRIINSGEECSLNWAVYTETPATVLCEVVSGGGETIKIDPADGNSGTATFSNVTSSTNYTMSCYGAVGGDGPTIKTKTSTLLSEETARCVINPNFREF